MSACSGCMSYVYLMFPVVKEMKSRTMIQDSSSKTSSGEVNLSPCVLPSWKTGKLLHSAVRSCFYWCTWLLTSAYVFKLGIHATPSCIASAAPQVTACRVEKAAPAHSWAWDLQLPLLLEPKLFSRPPLFALQEPDGFLLWEAYFPYWPCFLGTEVSPRQFSVDTQLTF